MSAQRACGVDDVAVSSAVKVELDGIPVAIVTLGPTRGDAKAAVRVDAPLGVVLPALAARLAG